VTLADQIPDLQVAGVLRASYPIFIDKGPRLARIAEITTRERPAIGRSERLDESIEQVPD
jgi:hypothetical protein